MRKLSPKSTAFDQFSHWFRGLNTKIIIYFISFGFLPLILFSILGYFFNKEMITRMNKANLRIINRNYANELDLFFKQKYRILQLAVSLDREQKDRILKSEFVVVVDNEQDEKRPELDYLPYIAAYTDNGSNYKGYIVTSELQSMIQTDNSEYTQYIYLPAQSLVIYADSVGHTDARSIEDFKNQEIEQAADDRFIIDYPLNEFGYVVRTSINASAFYAELDDFRNIIFLGNGILAMIVLILAIVYSQQITTPIHKLIKAVQHIGQGNLEHRIQLETNDEIQILANEFEIMRQKLYESYQGLEEKIEARTRQLQEAQAQISHQEKMASLGLMAAGIAHEIGNPLTSISSLAQVIRRKSEDEKTIEHVNNILKGIERISRIVRELVDFSKPSIHEQAFQDVNEIINSAVGIIKYDRRSKHIAYELDLDQSLPRIKMVGDHLLQVLLNILINAVDASEGFGNQIRVQSYHQNGHVNIDIQDQGCGIPGELQNKIFEPFYTTKEVGKGTGLGLSVSYGLIKKMNGKITVKSRPTEGSTFTVILPLTTQSKE